MALLFIVIKKALLLIIFGLGTVFKASYRFGVFVGEGRLKFRAGLRKQQGGKSLCRTNESESVDVE